MNNEMEPAKNYVPGLGTEFYIAADEIDPSGLSGYLQANKVAHQDASTASDIAGLVTDFNTLLSNMQAAGVMAAS